MSDYIPTTDEIRAEFIEAYENNALPLEFRYSALVDMFDRWLKQVKAVAWAEGFDAGERDILEHTDSKDWNKECIPNPYLEEGK